MRYPRHRAPRPHGGRPARRSQPDDRHQSARIRAPSAIRRPNAPSICADLRISEIVDQTERTGCSFYFRAWLRVTSADHYSSGPKPFTTRSRHTDRRAHPWSRSSFDLAEREKLCISRRIRLRKSWRRFMIVASCRGHIARVANGEVRLAGATSCARRERDWREVERAGETP